ncbi:MAG: type II toxin-antitoxin system VapB family antitoxin, partial [Mycobacterium sp.]|uniref:type II toxin-antitoxin system VapB family antitoxin n=2 Tax=Mycobacterium sp. TaxID=1785 RepID=UPI003F9E8F7A
DRSPRRRGYRGGAHHRSPQRLGTIEVYYWCMARTNIEIDDELAAEVMRRFGLTTKRAAVDLALRRLVGVQLTREFLLGLAGIGWEGDLDALRHVCNS